MRTSKYSVNWELSNVKQDEVKKWAIYLHYAPEDGRVYVGKTSQKPVEIRFANGACLRNNGGYKGRFREYMTTHPLEDMIHVVVDTTDDDLEAKRLEEAYTELYQSTDERLGFNTYVGDMPDETLMKSCQESEAWRESRKRSWSEGGTYRESWKEGGACREANCKYQYTIRHPDGEVTITDNLTDFCREKGIKQPNMVTNGYSLGYRVISKTLKEER